MARLNAYVAAQPPGSIILKHEPESNVVYLEGIRFEFGNGKLVKVLQQRNTYSVLMIQ